MARAQFDWKPRDWFGIRVGRYLTPYGIWNVDHGSPTIIGIGPPSAITQKLVPGEQTGLMAFGRFFPGSWSQIDYAVTFSNGRGPFDQVLDLDDHKATGLLLRYSWSKGRNGFALGGYGYLGTYVDSTRVGHLYLNDEGTMDEEEPYPLQIVNTIQAKYHEYILTGDARLDLADFSLFAEYVWRLVDYDKHPEADIYQVMSKGASADVVA